MLDYLKRLKNLRHRINTCLFCKKGILRFLRTSRFRFQIPMVLPLTSKFGNNFGVNCSKGTGNSRISLLVGSFKIELQQTLIYVQSPSVTLYYYAFYTIMLRSGELDKEIRTLSLQSG